MQWYIGPVMIIMTISSKVIANNILYGPWIWYTANTEKKHFHLHGLSGIRKKDGMFFMLWPESNFKFINNCMLIIVARLTDMHAMVHWPSILQCLQKAYYSYIHG